MAALTLLQPDPCDETEQTLLLPSTLLLMHAVLALLLLVGLVTPVLLPLDISCEHPPAAQVLLELQLQLQLFWQAGLLAVVLLPLCNTMSVQPWGCKACRPHARAPLACCVDTSAGVLSTWLLPTQPVLLLVLRRPKQDRSHDTGFTCDTAGGSALLLRGVGGL
jgi:hypothetical protein